MSEEELNRALVRADMEYEHLKDKARDIDNIQEKYNGLITDYRMSIEKRVKLEQRIDKAQEKLQSMFDNGNEETVLEDLLELDKILRGGKE